MYKLVSTGYVNILAESTDPNAFRLLRLCQGQEDSCNDEGDHYRCVAYLSVEVALLLKQQLGSALQLEEGVKL